MTDTALSCGKKRTPHPHCVHCGSLQAIDREAAEARCHALQAGNVQPFLLLHQ